MRKTTRRKYYENHFRPRHDVRALRITEALKAKDLKFTVDLGSKTVTIDGCEHCAATAMGELEDLGFTPELK